MDCRREHVRALPRGSAPRVQVPGGCVETALADSFTYSCHGLLTKAIRGHLESQEGDRDPIPQGEQYQRSPGHAFRTATAFLIAQSSTQFQLGIPDYSIPIPSLGNSPQPQGTLCGGLHISSAPRTLFSSCKHHCSAHSPSSPVTSLEAPTAERMGARWALTKSSVYGSREAEPRAKASWTEPQNCKGKRGPWARARWKRRSPSRWGSCRKGARTKPWVGETPVGEAGLAGGV